MKRIKAYIANRRRERELDLLNNPRKMVFVSDIAKNAAMIVAFSVVFMAIVFGMIAFCDMAFNIMGV